MAYYFFVQKEFDRYLEYKIEALKVRWFCIANLTLLFKAFKRNDND